MLNVKAALGFYDDKQPPEGFKDDEKIAGSTDQDFEREGFIYCGMLGPFFSEP